VAKIGKRLKAKVRGQMGQKGEARGHSFVTEISAFVRKLALFKWALLSTRSRIVSTFLKC